MAFDRNNPTDLAALKSEITTDPMDWVMLQAIQTKA